MLSCAFSHSHTAHIFLNCLTFYFMAPPILSLLGNTSFMGLYIFGGLACSVCSLFLNKAVLHRDAASNGASGVFLFFLLLSNVGARRF